MILILKIGCIAIYAGALLGLADFIPSQSARILGYIALAMLVIHALEAVLFFKYVRLYRGRIEVSVLLTFLFGVLHWRPLADAAKG
jgi:hypothetical protein